MLKKEDFFKIGNIQKPHGIKGEVVLHFDREIADDFEGQDTVFIEIDGGLVPFFISTYRFQSLKSALVLFQLAQTQEEIKEIVGKPVFLENKKQAEVESPEMNYLDLSGFTLFDQNRNLTGIIKGLIENPDNPLLEIEQDTTEKKEILIPFQEDLIIDINESEKWLQMKLPEGLLEI